MIRRATEEDRESVLSLLDALVVSQIQHGGHMRPGQLTTEWLSGCLDRGICRVTEVSGDVVAMSLAVPTELPYDHALGNVAAGIGTYVTQSHRKQGHAGALYAAMAKELKSAGFSTYLGGYLLGNKDVQLVLQRAGFVPYEAGVALHLGGQSCPQS